MLRTPLPYLFSAGPVAGRVQASSFLLHLPCCPLCLGQDWMGVQRIHLLGLFEVFGPQEKPEFWESWLGSYKQDKHRTLGGLLWGCLSKEKIVTGFHFKNWVLVLFCSVYHAWHNCMEIGAIQCITAGWVNEWWLYLPINECNHDQILIKRLGSDSLNLNPSFVPY